MVADRLISPTIIPGEGFVVPVGRMVRAKRSGREIHRFGSAESDNRFCDDAKSRQDSDTVIVGNEGWETLTGERQDSWNSETNNRPVEAPKKGMSDPEFTI